MSERPARIGIIHATPAAMEPVRAAFAVYLPMVVALNFLDEGLLDGLNQAGRLTPALLRRLATVVGQADSAGVQVIMTTCSAYSPVMEAMRPLASVPIITIDGLLFEEAARAAEHLGVIVAGERGIETTLAGLRAEAARQGRQQRYSSAAVPAAFAAILNNDVVAAGQALRPVAERLVGDGVGALMLAQASLSRALPLLGELGVPVLTSPMLAVGRVAQELGLSLVGGERSGPFSRG